MSFVNKKSAEDLPNDVKHQVYDIKSRQGKFEAIKFLAMEHNVGLSDAKRFVESHDEFGRLTGFRNGWSAKGILAKIFIGIGLLLMIVSCVIFYFQKDFIKNSIDTTCTVTELINDGGSYAPVFHYEINGQSYNTQINIWTNPPAYKINEQVHIWVNQSDPSDILIDSITGRYLTILILTAIGMVFSLIGIVFTIFSKRP
jgi:hypothetical protein